MITEIEATTPPINASGFIEALPQDMLDIVSEICLCQMTPCCCPPFEVYLGGSSVLYLINKVLPADKKDYDFSIITHAPQWLDAPSFSTFIRSKHLPHHYFRNTNRVGGISADLMITSRTLYESAQLGDLTLCTMKIRVNGKPHEVGLLYDPTGRGLYDLKHKQLNTVNEPKSYFERNPVCVLRTIKYLIRGYTPTHALTEALKSWHDPLSYENDHFMSVLTRQLESLHYLEFINMMKTYGLIKKINWASADDHEDPNLICQKFLSIIYLRFYQRTILNYAYMISPHSIPLIETQPGYFSINSELSLAWQHRFIANQRRYSAQKYSEQLRTKIISMETKSTQKDHEITACQARITHLTSQIETHKEQLLLKKTRIATLSQLTTAHTCLQKTSEKLQTELHTIHVNIEKKTQTKLKDNARQRSIQRDDSQQHLQKEKETLAEAHKKNQKQQLKIDKLREKLHQTNQQKQQNITQLEHVHQDIKQIQSASVIKVPASQLSISASSSMSPDVDSETMISIPVEKSISFNLKIEESLDGLSRAELESALNKIGIIEFRIILAYKLGVHAHNRQDYFKAFYYFNITQSAFPQHQDSIHYINEIKSKCPTISWSEQDPKRWCAKGSLAKKEKNIDEALLYYTLAIQCDTMHLNAYVGRINIFYQQNNWIAFIQDHQKILSIITKMKQTSNPETHTNLHEIEMALNKKISSSISKQRLMQKDVNYLTALNAWWDRALTAKIAQVDTQELILERIACYTKIVTLDLNKSILYGIAHFELARNYLLVHKDTSACYHYYEAICISPSLNKKLSLLDNLSSEHPMSRTLLTREDYVGEGYTLQLRHCYYLALLHFDKCIELFPTTKHAYWAWINCCFQMHRIDLLQEKIIDGLIQLYEQDQPTLLPIEYLLPLSELYLYKSEYRKSKIILEKLKSLSPVTSSFFCENLNTELTTDKIDSVRHRNKEYYSQLYDDEIYMTIAKNRFKLNRELGKIARDENHTSEALSYFIKAKAERSQEINIYDYHQMLRTLIELYITTEQLDKADCELNEILTQTDHFDLQPFARKTQQWLHSKRQSNTATTTAIHETAHAYSTDQIHECLFFSKSEVIKDTDSKVKCNRFNKT